MITQRTKAKLSLVSFALLWLWMLWTGFQEPGPNVRFHGWAYTGLYALCFGTVTFCGVYMISGAMGIIRRDRDV